MNSSYYNINITLCYTNYNFIVGVVAVPDLVPACDVGCGQMSATGSIFVLKYASRDVSQCPLFGAERRSLLGG